MTTIHIVEGERRRPQLTVADTFDVTVPAEVSHARLLAHAQRVARLTAELSAAKGRCDANHREHALGWAYLPSVGVALSQALDLGMETDPAKVGRWVREHAFPVEQGSRGGSMRLAVQVDVPRYQNLGYLRYCPIPGPRGGECRERNRTCVKYVTDPATGDWLHAEVCKRHYGQVAEALRAAPTPAPNRGGVLARVFHEWDLDPMYRWADDRYDPASIPVGADTSQKPALRVIEGGL